MDTSSSKNLKYPLSKPLKLMYTCERVRSFIVISVASVSLPSFSFCFRISLISFSNFLSIFVKMFVLPAFISSATLFKNDSLEMNIIYSVCFFFNQINVLANILSFALIFSSISSSSLKKNSSSSMIYANFELLPSLKVFESKLARICDIDLA